MKAVTTSSTLVSPLSSRGKIPLFRSLPEVPAHTPNSSRFSRAERKQSSNTGQASQSFDACLMTLMEDVMLFFSSSPKYCFTPVSKHLAS